MVLLDSDKAFDRVSQAGVFIAMEGLGVSKQIIDCVKLLYENPELSIDISGDSSGWYRQKTGIRHGCPLSRESHKPSTAVGF